MYTHAHAKKLNLPYKWSPYAMADIPEGLVEPQDAGIVNDDDLKFSINGWFNEHPIRAIGTTIRPYFYAVDIGTVLGIQNITTSLRHFDETELVSPDERIREKLITYRKYRNGWREDQSIVLLTEAGVYRMVMNSRSTRATEFKRHIINLVHAARVKERESLNIVTPEQMQQYVELRQKMSEIDRYNPIIYVFERQMSPKDNPYGHMLPRERDPALTKGVKTLPIGSGGKKLYKFTTKPCPDDYTWYNLHSKMYGTASEILQFLTEDSVDVAEHVMAYARYHESDDVDMIIDSVEAVCPGTVTK